MPTGSMTIGLKLGDRALMYLILVVHMTMWVLLGC